MRKKKKLAGSINRSPPKESPEPDKTIAEVYQTFKEQLKLILTTEMKGTPPRHFYQASISET